MARVVVVGTGYVGTVTAVCLAWLGHEVVGLDVEESRIAELSAGRVPFFEPGLQDLLLGTIGDGRLSFTSDKTVTANAEVIFLCVGTPTGPGGNPDMSQVAAAVYDIATHLTGDVVVVNKSTVPVGSGNWVKTLIEEAMPHGAEMGFSVVSNPEFLREGAAVEDFLYPARIVLGGEDFGTSRIVALYDRVLRQDFVGGRPDRLPGLVLTSVSSAEMVKYAANAFLATKISFANEIATICEMVGADAREVLPAIGADERIGPRFLQPGVGWGGSCFAKDVAALSGIGLEYGYGSPLLRATVEVNQAQRASVVRKLQASLKVLKGRRIAILGLAFKPHTDDLRDAPALEIIRRLQAAGALMSAYDPVVKVIPDMADVNLRMATDAYEAARRADAVVIATEWPEFRTLDMSRLAGEMKGQLILDGRGIIDIDAAVAVGLTVKGYGW